MKRGWDERMKGGGEMRGSRSIGEMKKKGRRRSRRKRKRGGKWATGNRRESRWGGPRGGGRVIDRYSNTAHRVVFLLQPDI